MISMCFPVKAGAFSIKRPSSRRHQAQRSGPMSAPNANDARPEGSSSRSRCGLRQPAVVISVASPLDPRALAHSHRVALGTLGVSPSTGN